MLERICDQPQSLKEFTDNHYAQASFFWDRLLKDKSIKVNGARVKENVRLNVGDTVTYYLTPKQASKSAYSIVYQDENVLVVDKESGVNSEAIFAALSEMQECYFIHRLDRNTQGLLIFARNARAESALLQAFKERRVEKIYHALCFGEITVSRAILKAYLKKDEKNALAFVSDRPIAGSEEICTEYRVLDRPLPQVTRLEIVLHTGKTHQIRAHLAHVGFPLVGDMKYGDTAKNKAFKSARQCLVSKHLKLSLNGEFAYLNEKTFTSRFTAELSTAREKGG